jgi:hypothetical protein
MFTVLCVHISMTGSNAIIVETVQFMKQKLETYVLVT